VDDRGSRRLTLLLPRSPLSPLNYITNIRRVLALATADEIRDGLAFYWEFHGVARVLAAAYGLRSIAHGAGLLAALSPMNNWHDNVTDAFHVAQWTSRGLCRLDDTSTWPVVRTTQPNREKAVRIGLGDHPEHVLKGRKVRSFYLCTAAPDAGCCIAVDRHLACAAAGEVLSDHGITSLLATDYLRIERTYMEMAAAEGLLGHQLASVVWFAWRRMKSQSTLGQRLIA